MIGAAIMVGRIATGEVVEIPKPKSGRTRSGNAGAKARSTSLSPRSYSAIAKSRPRQTQQAAIQSQFFRERCDAQIQTETLPSSYRQSYSLDRHRRLGLSFMAVCANR